MMKCQGKVLPFVQICRFDFIIADHLLSVLLAAVLHLTAVILVLLVAWEFVKTSFDVQTFQWTKVKSILSEIHLHKSPEFVFSFQAVTFN